MDGIFFLCRFVSLESLTCGSMHEPRCYSPLSAAINMFYKKKKINLPGGKKKKMMNILQGRTLGKLGRFSKLPLAYHTYEYSNNINCQVYKRIRGSTGGTLIMLTKVKFYLLWPFCGVGFRYAPRKRILFQFGCWTPSFTYKKGDIKQRLAVLMLLDDECDTNTPVNLTDSQRHTGR